MQPCSAKPALTSNWGIWVVFPLPVSPTTTKQSLSCMCCSKAFLAVQTGSCSLTAVNLTRLCITNDRFFPSRRRLTATTKRFPSTTYFLCACCSLVSGRNLFPEVCARSAESSSLIPCSCTQAVLGARGNAVPGVTLITPGTACNKQIMSVTRQC